MLRSPAEARDYLVALRDILVHLGVCDGNMEEGSFRCDANISLRPRGQAALGTKVEIKNMNSFRYVQQALEYETARQEALLDEGGAIVQETRLFDPKAGTTHSMRRKEEAHDYRYFPEPDLVPLAIDAALVARVAAAMPELPEARRRRYVESLGLPEYDAGVLTADPALAAWFEAAVAAFPQPKTVSNWVMGELLRLLRDSGRDVRDCPVPPAELAALLAAVEAGTMTRALAKGAFETMFREGKTAAAVIAAQGLAQLGGGDELAALADRVVAENPDKVAGYRGGKVKLFEFFVGQVMRASGGRANPDEIRRLLKERLDSMICPRVSAPTSAGTAASECSSCGMPTVFMGGGDDRVAATGRVLEPEVLESLDDVGRPGSRGPRGPRRCTSVPLGCTLGPGCGCIGLPLAVLAGVVVSSVIALLWVLSLGRLPARWSQLGGAGAPGLLPLLKPRTRHARDPLRRQGRAHAGGGGRRRRRGARRRRDPLPDRHPLRPRRRPLLAGRPRGALPAQGARPGQAGPRAARRRVPGRALRRRGPRARGAR